MQEQYREEIKGEVVKILNDVYGVIQKQQSASFSKMVDVMQKTVTDMEKKITACTEKCKVQTADVKNMIEKMRKVESWQDILLWISPMAVIADLVIRVIQYFGLA